MNEKKLKQLISEAVVEALTVEITWEKHKDEKTGFPLATPELKTEKVFLPSFIMQHLKFQEGAFRGLQEDVDHAKNAMSNQVEKIDAIGKAFLTLEGSALTIVSLAHAIKTGDRRLIVPLRQVS